MSTKGEISTHFEISLEFEDDLGEEEIHISCSVCTERQAARAECWGKGGKERVRATLVLWIQPS